MYICDQNVNFRRHMSSLPYMLKMSMDDVQVDLKVNFAKMHTIYRCYDILVNWQYFHIEHK